MKHAVDRRVAFARTEVEGARDRIAHTAATLRYRLSPTTLVANTGNRLIELASEKADDATTVIRARPWLIAIVATLAGLLIAARSRVNPDQSAGATNDEV